MPEALRSSPTIFFGLIQMKIPRSLSTKSTSTSFIFTDASHEPDAERTTAGIGAVLVNHVGEKVSFFSRRIDRRGFDENQCIKEKGNHFRM